MYGGQFRKQATAAIYSYGKTTGSGVRGQSCRVILDGGNSTLPYNRKNLAQAATELRLAAAGSQKAFGQSGYLLGRKFPPKMVTFNRYMSNFPSGSNRRFASKSMQEVFDPPGEGVTDTALMTIDQRPESQALVDRSQIAKCSRIVIKLGSAVITREDGNGLALGRLASIVEQIAELQNEGRQCILITSGAVAFGKQKLIQESIMSMTMRETLTKTNIKENMKDQMKNQWKKPNAAVGQSGLQALYETMFRNYGIIVGQVLVTKADFYNAGTRNQLFSTIEELLSLNIIPIINTNDAVSPPMNQDSHHDPNTLNINDNDSLASRIACETHADLSLLLSDVDGIYNKPPSDDNARILHTFNPSDMKKVKFGEKSDVGTGGMESKVNSALWALEGGCSTIIANGMKYNTIRKIMKGEKIGSFFSSTEPDTIPVEELAKNAREGSRRLQSLSPAERSQIIVDIADNLIKRQDEIMIANEKDLDDARKKNITGPLFDRLKFTHEKIQSLSVGLKQIADSSLTNVGRVVRRTKVSETLDLVQKTVPIGVLMVIFESRPDALPQVACLAIASGNGLLLKGGKEAANSNECLSKIVRDCLKKYSCEDAVSMVSTREAISDLLKLENMIDLVIPRGSSDLVRDIKEKSASIPVLGHAEGICHVYIDKAADLKKALDIVKDSKTDYPAACNAMETLLFHEDCYNNGIFDKVCNMLKEHNVKIFSGPKLAQHLTFGPPPAKNMKQEYSDLECTVEIVPSIYNAIEHIHAHGSGHTDVIVTEDPDSAATFMDSVDSACVFHNASSRMSDGFRLGLGAEVGISTGRIHARGPVGVEGLLTTKWVLQGQGDTAEDYSTGRRIWTHKQLPIAEPMAEE